MRIIIIILIKVQEKIGCKVQQFYIHKSLIQTEASNIIQGSFTNPLYANFSKTIWIQRLSFYYT